MKKIFKVKYLLTFLLLLCFSTQPFVNNKVSAVGSTGSVGGSSEANARSIKIKDSPRYISIGQTYTFKASIDPSNATDKTITWISSDSSILSIDKNGKATAKKMGTVKLTAKTSNGKTDSIPITVRKEESTTDISKVKSISIKNNPKEMLIGDKVKLKISISPKFVDDETLTFKSSNNKVLKVDSNGLVTAVGKGTAKITVTSRSNKKASQTITIKVSGTKITLNKTSVNVSKGDTVALTATVKSNKDYSTNEVKWQSTSTSNATVKQNSKTKNQYKATVSAKKQGTATVKVSVGGEVATAKVKVIEKGQDYSLNCPTMSYDTTDNKQIKITIKPATTTAKWDYYTSTNKKTGSNASWKKIKSYTGSNQTTVTSNYTEAQGKIIVYGKEGTSRVCYTAPFDYDKSKKSNTKITYAKSGTVACPQFTYSDQLKSGAKKYTIKEDYAQNVITGVKKTNITITPKANTHNQYSWYSNKDNSKKQLYKTFTNKTPASLTINTSYDRKGYVLAMNSSGDVKVCNTETYSNLAFKSKTTVNGTDIYVQTGYDSSLSNAIINIVKSLPSYYLAAPEIFLVNKNNFEKISGHSDWCGKTNSNSNIVYITSPWVYNNGGGCPSDWIKATVVHELGHTMDNMYGYFSIKREPGHNTIVYGFLSDSNANQNAYNNTNRQKYLTNYAFTDSKEFFAELTAIRYMNTHKTFNGNSYKGYYTTDTTLNNLNNSNMKTIQNLYSNNQTKWKKYKDGYRVKQ